MTVNYLSWNNELEFEYDCVFQHSIEVSSQTIHNSLHLKFLNYLTKSRDSTSKANSRKESHEDWMSSQSSSMCLSAAETLSWHQLKRLHLSLQGKLKSSMLVILSDKVTRCQAGRAWPPRLSSGLLRVFSPLKTSVPTGQCLNYVWDTEIFACVNVACSGIHLFSVTWNQDQNTLSFWW